MRAPTRGVASSGCSAVGHRRPTRSHLVWELLDDSVGERQAHFSVRSLCAVATLVRCAVVEAVGGRARRPLGSSRPRREVRELNVSRRPCIYVCSLAPVRRTPCRTSGTTTTPAPAAMIRSLCASTRRGCSGAIRRSCCTAAATRRSRRRCANVFGDAEDVLLREGQRVGSRDDRGGRLRARAPRRAAAAGGARAHLGHGAGARATGRDDRSAAPDPSVEAVLHAIIPYAFVDHTHADAVVALTNTPHGAERDRRGVRRIGARRAVRDAGIPACARGVRADAADRLVADTPGWCCSTTASSRGATRRARATTR